jgi:hypothetical protein
MRAIHLLGTTLLLSVIGAGIIVCKPSSKVENGPVGPSHTSLLKPFTFGSNPQQQYIPASPIALPTTPYDYTSSVDARSISLSSVVNIALDANVTSATSVAVFTTENGGIVSGGPLKTFDVTDPTTWPPGCNYLGIMTGGNPISDYLNVASGMKS